MSFYSPLRYPGGKNKLAKLIGNICVENNINGHYVEPYAGGASVALYLIIEKKINKITINDLDRSIYAFWYAVLKRTNKLCQLIEETPINIDEWKKAKLVQKNKENAKLLNLGFSTLFLNRTNVSGIINGGVIGGYQQNGSYKIDCRFNKQEIIHRVRRIAEHRRNIKLYNLNAIDLIKKIEDESKKTQTIFYFDPPYYLKGESLYMNHYDHDDHVELSEEIRKIKDFHWIISYDKTETIKKIYNWCDNEKELSLKYTAREKKMGEELLFFSESLKFEV